MAKAKKEKAVKEPKAKEVKAMFDPGLLLDDIQDAVEKKYGLSSTTLTREDERLSTGLVSIDMILDGGIVGGGWYTVYGGEQSCKSTLTMQLLSMIVNEVTRRARKIAAAIFDYEGCLTGDSELVICVDGNITPITFKRLVEEYSEVVYDTFVPLKENVSVRLGEEFIPIQSAKVIKSKPITSITLANNQTLRGYKHPIMVKNADSLLEWRFIEDLKIDDHVVVRNS